LDKVTITRPIHDELKRTYRAEFLGKLKNLIPLCPLDDKQPGAEHTLCFSSIYPKRKIIKIRTQSQYT
jgi:hypothetical protein